MLFLRLRSSNVVITRCVDPGAIGTGVRMEEKNYNISEFRRMLVKFNEEEVVVYTKHLDLAQSYDGAQVEDVREIAMYGNSEL